MTAKVNQKSSSLTVKLKVKNKYSIFGERLVVTEDGLGRKTFFRHDKKW